MAIQTRGEDKTQEREHAPQTGSQYLWLAPSSQVVLLPEGRLLFGSRMLAGIIVAIPALVAISTGSSDLFPEAKISL